MTDEEKEKYRGGLIATCKTYCHIDYDDDIEILELMLDTTLDEMTELIRISTGTTSQAVKNCLYLCP